MVLFEKTNDMYKFEDRLEHLNYNRTGYWQGDTFNESKFEGETSVGIFKNENGHLEYDVNLTGKGYWKIYKYGKEVGEGLDIFSFNIFKNGDILIAYDLPDDCYQNLYDKEHKIISNFEKMDVVEWIDNGVYSGSRRDDTAHYHLYKLSDMNIQNHHSIKHFLKIVSTLKLQRWKIRQGIKI